jgi:hypothetical protein
LVLLLVAVVIDLGLTYLPPDYDQKTVRTNSTIVSKLFVLFILFDFTTAMKIQSRPGGVV